VGSSGSENTRTTRWCASACGRTLVERAGRLQGESSPAPLNAMRVAACGQPTIRHATLGKACRAGSLSDACSPWRGDTLATSGAAHRPVGHSGRSARLAECSARRYGTTTRKQKRHTVYACRPARVPRTREADGVCRHPLAMTTRLTPRRSANCLSRHYRQGARRSWSVIVAAAGSHP
jgi:hypothetical protein